MKKRKHVGMIRLGQRGMTLIEIVVSMGLVGLCFLALMTILNQVGSFSAYFTGTAATIEGVTEAVSLFSGVVPETTRILSCNCQANTSARANCIWDAQNPWYDPIRTGGAAGMALFSFNPALPEINAEGSPPRSRHNRAFLPPCPLVSLLSRTHP
ncbi:MAG: type II secretion system protein [Bdellovibrionota bacterium]